MSELKTALGKLQARIHKSPFIFVAESGFVISSEQVSVHGDVIRRNKDGTCDFTVSVSPHCLSTDVPLEVLLGIQEGLQESQSSSENPHLKDTANDMLRRVQATPYEPKDLDGIHVQICCGNITFLPRIVRPGTFTFQRVPHHADCQLQIWQLARHEDLEEASMEELSGLSGDDSDMAVEYAAADTEEDTRDLQTHEYRIPDSRFTAYIQNVRGQAVLEVQTSDPDLEGAVLPFQFGEKKGKVVIQATEFKNIFVGSKPLETSFKEALGQHIHFGSLHESQDSEGEE